jgi:hypothetical protein
MSGLLMAAAAAGHLAAPALRHCRNLNPHVAVTLGGLAGAGAAAAAGEDGRSDISSSSSSGGVVFAAPRSASSGMALAASASPVVASTSSFGMSGVNAHAVIDVAYGGGNGADRASVLVADSQRLWCAPPARQGLTLLHHFSAQPQPYGFRFFTETPPNSTQVVTQKVLELSPQRW